MPIDERSRIEIKRIGLLLATNGGFLAIGSALILALLYFQILFPFIDRLRKREKIERQKLLLASSKDKTNAVPEESSSYRPSI